MKKVRRFSLFLTLAMFLATLPVSASEPLLIAPAPTADPPILISPAPDSNGIWLLPAVNPLPEFPDVEGSWCEEAVDTAWQVGLMGGKTETFFDIRSPLTYAQTAVITARFHHLLNGGDGVLPDPAEGESWYQPAVDYLNAASDDSALLTLLEYLEWIPSMADNPCARRDFVWMLAAILPDTALTPINDVSGVPDSISSHVLEFYQAGILGGSDKYGTFGEERPLTRGAACAILARIIDPAQRISLSMESVDLCRDILGVDRDTVLLTTEYGSVTAEMFAWQLCAALYGQMGDEAAITDAVWFWCNYEAPFHILAEQKGVTLSAEALAEIAATAARQDGYQAASAAYWQRQLEASALNTALLDTYNAVDPRYGMRTCANDLIAVSDRLVATAVPTEVLASLDPAAVYQRLMASPWTGWVMLAP